MNRRISITSILCVLVAAAAISVHCICIQNPTAPVAAKAAVPTSISAGQQSNKTIHVELFMPDSVDVVNVKDQHGKPSKGAVIPDPNASNVELLTDRSQTFYVNISGDKKKRVTIEGDYTLTTNGVPGQNKLVLAKVLLDKSGNGYLAVAVDIAKGTVTWKGGTGKWSGK